ncbi:MAG: hypothetical protein JSW38_10415 [Dehalococcoidia bacterium]|nr:MAG: hypothetical protein JSW38_10415 [Dehalococcoidia bacterium]
MLEVLVRLEYKRQALRRQGLKQFSDVDRGLYAIGGVIALALSTGLIAPTVAAATAPPEIVAIAVAISLGLVLSATVILLPVGLFFL